MAKKRKSTPIKSASLLKGIMTDILERDEITRFGKSQGGNIDDIGHDGQESDLERLVRRRLDKIYPGYMRQTFHVNEFYNTLKELPSEDEVIGDTYSEKTSKTAELAEKLGTVPAYYAILAAEHAYKQGFSTEELDTSKGEESVKAGARKFYKAMGVKHNQEEFAREAIKRADYDKGISSTIMKGILNSDVAIPYGVGNKFQTMMQEGIYDYFWKEGELPDVPKRKRTDLLLARKGLMKNFEETEALSILQKAYKALNLFEENADRTDGDSIASARNDMMKNLGKIDGSVDMLDFRGIVDDKMKKSNYQLHIVPFIEKSREFLINIYSHYKGKLKEDRRLIDFIGTDEYFRDVVVPDMEEHLSSISSSDDYSPDMVMLLHKQKPGRALYNRHDLVREITSDFTKAIEEDEKSPEYKQELIAEYRNRLHDLDILRKVFGQLTSEEDNEILQVQSEQITNAGREISETLMYGLNDVAQGTKSIDGVGLRQLLFDRLREHHNINHEGRKVLKAKEVDATADLTSKRSRPSGMKQDIEVDFETYGLHAELYPSVFSWYDDALWSFRHDTAENIILPVFEKLENLEDITGGLKSDYFTSGGGIRKLCDSVASRAAFYSTSDNEEEFIDMHEVYGAFLEEEYGEIDNLKNLLETAVGSYQPVPPPLPPGGKKPSDSPDEHKTNQIRRPSSRDEDRGGQDSGGLFTIESESEPESGLGSGDDETSMIYTGEDAKPTSDGANSSKSAAPPDPSGETMFAEIPSIPSDEGNDKEDGLTLEAFDSGVPSDALDRIREAFESGDQYKYKETIDVLKGHKVDIEDLQGVIESSFHRQQKLREELEETRSDCGNYERELTATRAALDENKRKEPGMSRRKFWKGAGIGLLVGALAAGAGGMAAGARIGSEEDRPTINYVMSKYNLAPQFEEALQHRYNLLLGQSSGTRRGFLGFFTRDKEKAKEKAAKDIDELASVLAYTVQPEFNNLNDAMSHYETACETPDNKLIQEYHSKARVYSANVKETSLASMFISTVASRQLYTTKGVATALYKTSQGYQSLANEMFKGSGHCIGYIAGEESVECPLPQTPLKPIEKDSEGPGPDLSGNNRVKQYSRPKRPSASKPRPRRTLILTD